MPTEKLTKRSVEALRAQSARFIVWDTDIAGLGVRVQPTGRKAFVLFYRTRDGVQRKPTLGNFGTLTVETARELARDMLADVRRGEDPSQSRQAARQAATIDDLADRYMAEHARAKKKPRSADADETNLKLHVRPRWGTRKIASISSNDVLTLHHEMRKKPGAANRVISLLSKMFNLAEAWGLRPQGSNPCKHVQKYAGKKLHHHLNEIELARLAKVLREAEAAWIRIDSDKGREGDAEIAAHPVAVAAIRLLILTGMRKGEVLNLKWSEVDYDQRVLRLEDSKDQHADKPREPKVIPMSQVAEELLRAQEKIPGNPHVFPGRIRGAAFVGFPKIAKKLYKEAKLAKDFRPAHDWRHNFGTAGAEGHSLPMIGKLLGHKSSLTTARYAKAAEDPQRRAADQIAGHLAEVMRGDGAKG